MVVNLNSTYKGDYTNRDITAQEKKLSKGVRMSGVKRYTPHNTIKKFSCNCLNGKECCQNNPVYKSTESLSERIQQYIFQSKHLGFLLIQFNLFG